MLEQPDKLHDEMSGLVAETRTPDMVYLNFSKVFDIVSHMFLMSLGWIRGQ